MTARIIEHREFRNKTRIFEDRESAGRFLADMLRSNYEKKKDAVTLAIPSGGVPVGLVLAEELETEFDMIIVRKLKIPSNPEAGFGALTLAGDMFLNRQLLSYLNLSEEQIERQKEVVKKELSERNRIFRNGRSLPDIKNRTVILCDDGLASGYTMLAACHTVSSLKPAEIIIAVPTAPLRTIELFEHEVDVIVSAHVQESGPFAVAGAYRNWYDLAPEDVTSLLSSHGFGP